MRLFFVTGDYRSVGEWRKLRELNELSSTTNIEIDLDAIEESSQGAGLLTQRTTLLVETIVVSPFQYKI